MCLLLETIKLEDGKLVNLDYHQQRFDRALQHFFDQQEIQLREAIQVPKEAQTGTFRCRVIYNKEIQKIEFIPHQHREINSLRIVQDNSIDYEFKYADRNHLQQLFELRGNCDDIIIIKDGQATDSFTGNLLFRNDEKWLTPKNPLLKGTQRQYLLDNKLIHEATIKENEIHDFKKVGIINVFYTLQNMPVIKNINIHQ